jgi:hypothetical protein
MSGRSIRIFLTDGSATGILTAEIMNWTGKVVVAPRSQLADLARRDESKRTGVYVLVGEDPNSPLKDVVYIGESDNVFSRLTSHNQDSSKDFWTRTVVVISKDENLTKAHVRYLESRLIQLATQAGRASLTNGTAPATPPLPEPDTADMEFFLEQFQTLLPVLGFLFATPVPTISSSILTPTSPVITPPQAIPSPLLIASSTELTAEAQEIEGQFVVLKGSRARKIVKQSLSGTYVAFRDQLQLDKKLVETMDGSALEFATDIQFSSPSAAAAVITGTAVNGREFWRVKSTNQTYNQWDQARIAQATSAASSETEVEPKPILRSAQ